VAGRRSDRVWHARNGPSGQLPASASIGPGVSSLSDVDLNLGLFSAGVHVAPAIAFGPLLAGDIVPEAGWAPIEPQIELNAGAY